MVYLIGGAPRAGKSILGQQIAAELRVSWISTDLLLDLLRLKNDAGIKTEWNADYAAIRTNAEWFFPYFERFVWGVSSLAEDYVIEGVDFLPEQVVQLSKKFQIRSVFLGCSRMTLQDLEKFPGRSQGYANLPDALRCQIVEDVPVWSKFIRQESERFGIPYFDMSGSFSERLKEVTAMLTAEK